MTTEHQMALCANHWHKVAQSTMEALGAAQELLKTLYQNCGAAEAERDALRIECDDYKQTLGYIRGQEDKYQYRERHGFHRKIEFSEDGSTCEIVDTIEGQPVEYWHQVATSAMARNDTLISQLKEKEKIAAEQEQRITSLQNEILNRVYEGTQDVMTPVAGNYVGAERFEYENKHGVRHQIPEGDYMRRIEEANATARIYSIHREPSTWIFKDKE